MQDTAIPEIRWFTTVYVIPEDRLRVSCALKPEGSAVFWLTQRLANALVKKLLEWLDKQTVQDARYADVDHRMAQQGAVAKAPRKPRAPIPDAPAWLARSVGINSFAKGVVLTFKDDADRAVAIRFDADHLRRWLGVLHVQYRRSGWPTDIWPDWMVEGAGDQPAVPSGLLH